jgi:deoxyribonuclease V
MKIKELHKWGFSYKEAVGLQKRLAKKVLIVPMRKMPSFVAGLDCALSKDGKKIVAAVIVLKLPGFETVEIQHAVCKLTFPYIPGLLSFREAPCCLKAVRKLSTIPDAFLIDGHGYAHPRRFGIACHLGLFLDRPTIGCGKSRLIGEFREPKIQRGSFSLLKDKGQTIGAVVRTRTNVKPVFASIGNKCTVRDAIKVILACSGQYRIPEPTRLAHQLVNRLKTGI